MPTDRPLVVVITGVTSGLGKALAEEFKKSGATVIGCGRREKNLADLREAIWRTSQVLFVRCHLEESVAAFANKLKATGTPIDVVIANAGNAKTGVPWEQSPADFKSTIETNLVGCFHITRYFLPILMEQAQTESELAPLKRLINTSSGVGHSTNPLVSTYASSKWGVEALSKCTAQALRNAGFQDRVICVPFAPGVVSSEMNTFGWSHTTSEWAPAAVRFLLSIKAIASLSLPGFLYEEVSGDVADTRWPSGCGRGRVARLSERGVTFVRRASGRTKDAIHPQLTFIRFSFTLTRTAAILTSPDSAAAAAGFSFAAPYATNDAPAKTTRLPSTLKRLVGWPRAVAPMMDAKTISKLPKDGGRARAHAFDAVHEAELRQSDGDNVGEQRQRRDKR